MQKTYWWRIVVMLIGIITNAISFVVNNQLLFGLCDNAYFFGDNQGCLDGAANTFGEPLLFISLALVIISPFLFFINDIVFKKWLKFAFAWFALATVFITFSPVSDRSPLGLNPTKESVSIWMGSLFVIISLVLIFWQSHKLKKN